ncbi:hypothetical protein WG906_08920 [Pedobacter sp. P351]|uniref:hypothetical protein n=1 Tax=Pedobacter superstes TaxID=3133441 RepID=UPI0030A90F46
MLKLVYIFLLVYCNLSSASALSKLSSDTPKIVLIKILVHEKKPISEPASGTGITDSKPSNKRSFKPLASNKTNPVRLPKKLRQEISISDRQLQENTISRKLKPLASIKNNPVHLPGKLKQEITDSGRPLKKHTINRKFRPIPEKEGITQIRSPQKNKHMFISLLLIVTGTIVALFYRSGIFLIVAILLMITGYYLFIYSLLFMV